MIDKSYKYYFIDFFGTIMDRLCSADDIKKIWSNRVCLYLNEIVSSQQLYEIRISAEEYICSHNEYAEYLYDELIIEVYYRLQAFLNYENNMLNLEDFVVICKETEIQVEVENQQTNEKTVELINQLKSEQKKVYILSDYYFGSDVLEYYLHEKNVDILFDDILVSCNFMCNKSSGKIYELICKKLKIEPKDCFMIGDNYKSDYKNAQKYGFGSHQVKRNGCLNKKINVEKVFRCSLAKKRDLGMSYTNYSYMFFKFISRLYCELRVKKYEKVFFLSREGEYLKQLFDYYCHYMNQKFNLPIINSEYLYVSRQSTYPATLDSEKIDDFNILIHNYPNMSISAFLKNIGFGLDDRKRIESLFPNSFTKVIYKFAESEQYRNLLASEEFQNLYYATVRRKKIELHEYLSSMNFFDTGRVAIVDVGWKGSIQDNLWLSENGKIDIDGYYCGLNNNTKCMHGNTKKGLIFSAYPSKSKNYKIWSYDSNFLERLLSASHPSTNGYFIINDTVKPIFNSFETEENNYNSIKPVQIQIFEHFRKIVPMIFSLPVLSDELENELAFIHINTCCNINKSNMILQQKLIEGQVENFGFQMISGSRLKKAFTIRNIVKKIKNNIRLVLNIRLLINVCNNKKLYTLSVWLNHMQGKFLERELRK